MKTIFINEEIKMCSFILKYQSCFDSTIRLGITNNFFYKRNRMYVCLYLSISMEIYNFYYGQLHGTPCTTEYK